MGCGGSKDTISQKSPTGAQDLKQQVSEKDNPVVEHANLPSALGAEQLSPPTIIHETIQANDSNEIMASVADATEATDVLTRQESPLAAQESSVSASEAPVDELRGNDEQIERLTSMGSMAISSTDSTSNKQHTDGIFLHLQSGDDYDLGGSLSLTQSNSRPTSSINVEKPEREQSLRLDAIRSLSIQDNYVSSPKSAPREQPITTPNGTHSLQHADTGESCFNFPQLNLMELNEYSKVTLVYDTAEGGGEQQRPLSSSQSVKRTISGFHHPTVDRSTSHRLSISSNPQSPEKE